MSADARGYAGRGLLAAALLTAVAPSALGAGRLRIASEGDPGPLYECGASSCAPARIDDPSRKNRLGMEFYVLPAGCVELAGVSLLAEAAGVDVACGPPGHLSRYRCESGACRALLPGEDDDGTTRSLALPSDCGGRIHDVVVLDARTETPRVYVECDASSGLPPGM
jgi:hypothetical protein